MLEQLSRPMTEQKQALEAVFLSWKGELEQTDDVCLVDIKI